jgi:hypothetical protein
MITLALVPGQKSGDPGMKASVDAQTSSAADALAKAVKELAGTSSAVKVDHSGNRVDLTTSGWAAGSGALGDQAQYRTAMAGMPSPAGFAVYLNTAGLLDLIDASATDRKQFTPLKSFGMAVGMDGGDSVILARAVIQ